MNDTEEEPCYILKEYLNYHNKYIKIYGEKTVVLMMVGQFYEIYGVINDKIHDKYHIKPGETDAEKLFTLQTASCLGNCGAAPMAIIGEDTHGTIDPEKTYDILSEYKKDDEETPVTEEVG